METVAVVLMVLGLIGVGSALVVLVRLRGQGIGRAKQRVKADRQWWRSDVSRA